MMKNPQIKYYLIAVLFLLFHPMVMAAEICKDLTGNVVEITAGTLCATATNGYGDVAPLCLKGGSCPVSGDGSINISDAVVILRLALGLVDPATVIWPANGGTTFTLSVGCATNSLGMTFKLIPAGTFTMGSPSTETDHGSNEAQHQVTISKAFYLQTTEITQGQWKAVMGSNPSNFSSCGDTCPVENVSWDDIQTYIAKLNAKGEGIYRLPTEAEWEYAARAGTTTAWSFGDSSSKLGDYAWYSSNSSSKTHPVATKLPNPWGLYDMHGNVWEWVQDWYTAYVSKAQTDPIYDSSGSSRVNRGGSWVSDAGVLRSANRFNYSPVSRYYYLGARLAIVP